MSRCGSCAIIHAGAWAFVQCPPSPRVCLWRTSLATMLLGGRRRERELYAEYVLVPAVTLAIRHSISEKFPLSDSENPELTAWPPRLSVVLHVQIIELASACASCSHGMEHQVTVCEFPYASENGKKRAHFGA